MEHHITSGNEPLDEAGLVAFTTCGHWWVYPVRATVEEMHDLARFTLDTICSFCVAEWRAATHAQAWAPAAREN